MVSNFSGTISTTVFNVGKVIDRAFGRCKLAPQQITGEYIQIAKDMLYLHLSTLGNEGIPLWAKTKMILPLYEGRQNVPLDASVIDVLSANLRTSTRLTPVTPGQASASEGVATNAFDGDLTTACTQVTPGGFIQLSLNSPVNAPIWGFLPNTDGIWGYSFQVSTDGINFDTIYNATLQDVIADEWFWVDIEGLSEAGYTYFRMQADGTTTLDVVELVIENMPNEIPIAKINMDDYANLPDKWFFGRPVQCWYDKQIVNPQLTVWPSPQLQFTFNQIVLYVNRYIMDVGDMTNEIEVPQRWLLAVMTELARNLAMEIPEVKSEVLAILGPEADMQLKKAWASETDGSPTYLQANIRNYTR